MKLSRQRWWVWFFSVMVLFLEFAEGQVKEVMPCPLADGFDYPVGNQMQKDITKHVDFGPMGIWEKIGMD